jgi:hypothetical protein
VEAIVRYVSRFEIHITLMMEAVSSFERSVSTRLHGEISQNTAIFILMRSIGELAHKYLKEASGEQWYIK